MAPSLSEYPRLKAQIIDELKSGRTFMRRGAEEYLKIFFVRERGTFVAQHGDCLADKVTHETEISGEDDVLRRMCREFEGEDPGATREDVCRKILSYLSWGY